MSLFIVENEPGPPGSYRSEFNQRVAIAVMQKIDDWRNANCENHGQPHWQLSLVQWQGSAAYRYSEDTWSDGHLKVVVEIKCPACATQYRLHHYVDYESATHFIRDITSESHAPGDTFGGQS